MIAAHLLRQIDAARRERRAMLRSYRLMSTLLQELLPSWSWTPPKGGLSVWARLPTGSARQLATEALRHGVAILAGPVVSPNLSFDSHIRLTLARSPEVLTKGSSGWPRRGMSSPPGLRAGQEPSKSSSEWSPRRHEASRQAALEE